MIENQKEPNKQKNEYSRNNPNTTKACLYHDNNNENVVTNKLVQKWQNSHFLKPGQRIIHPALREDFQKVKVDNLIFGRPQPTHRKPFEKEHKKTVEEIHVEDILRGSTTSSSSCYSNGIGKFIGGNECQAMKHEINEKKVYKSAQRELGRSFHRGHVIPKFMKDENYRHGLKTRMSEYDAKALLYSSHFDESFIENEKRSMNNGDNEIHYANSHGTHLPGQQRKRNYNWPIDPITTVFGVKGQDAARRSSSKGVSEALHHDSSNAENDDLDRNSKKTDCDDDNNSDSNIQQKALWKDKNRIFGKATSKTNECAADCLRSLEQRSGDIDGKIIESDDLGKSVRPGFRNAMTEKRRFGCPSIRTDIPKYERHSVADTQNYGDDVNAEYLLRPSQCSSFGIEDDEFIKPRSREYIETLYKDSGYKISTCQFHFVWDKFCDENDCMSIQEFQNQYNKRCIQKRIEH